MGKLLYLDGVSRKMDKYSKENLIMFAKMVLFFTNASSTTLYKTKLNKLLFYAQFLYYKRSNERLLANDFIRDFYGPVMDELDVFLAELQNLNLICLEEDSFGTRVNASVALTDNNYNKWELAVLEQVIDKFDTFTSREISDYSHRELLWINTSNKSIIPLERAFELKGI